MTIFYNSENRNSGVIYKVKIDSSSTQAIIDDINYMIHNDIPRTLHLTVEDSYSEIIKDFENRILKLEEILENISSELINNINIEEYSVYEFLLLKNRKIEFINDKIRYIDKYIEDLKSGVTIVCDWSEGYKRPRPEYYNSAMLTMNNIFTY